jgi:hypothetical protein
MAGWYAAVTFLGVCAVVLLMAWRLPRRAVNLADSGAGGLGGLGPDVDALEREATLADWETR